VSPADRNASATSHPAQTGLLDWPAFLRYLNARATLGVEIINLENTSETQYIRSIDINGCTGTLMLAHYPTQPELLLATNQSHCCFFQHLWQSRMATCLASACRAKGLEHCSP
jgi:hypothetical protein